MIDLESRKKAAELTRRFIGGQITNIEFENDYPSSKDLAIPAIADTLWCFYDDFEEHCLSGKWDVPDETMALMKRWLLFLYSQQEYSWPKISHPGIRPITYGVLGKLFNRHKKQHDFLSSGDVGFWPFADRDSYEKAKMNPVLMAG